MESFNISISMATEQTQYTSEAVDVMWTTAIDLTRMDYFVKC